MKDTDTTYDLDALVWIGSFATALLVPRYVIGWSWWVAVPLGVVFGFVLYVPLWMVVIAILRGLGVVGPQESEDVRRPGNLGKKPERRG